MRNFSWNFKYSWDWKLVQIICSKHCTKSQVFRRKLKKSIMENLIFCAVKHLYLLTPLWYILSVRTYYIWGLISGITLESCWIKQDIEAVIDNEETLERNDKYKHSLYTFLTTRTHYFGIGYLCWLRTIFWCPRKL